MGLGPSLSIRQSQQLVLTPQLRQAIQLLQLSNLELDAYLAEELSKNPLLEAASGEGDEQQSGDLGDLARIIAETVDETGYLTVPLDQIAELTGAPLRLIEQALALVQGLEPPGVGARSLAECLALQAKAADRYDPAMARLIDNLELLSKGRTQDLKRICGVDEEDLADMVRELRAYDPKPGCRFSGGGSEEVAPDVFVRRTR